MDEMMAAWMKYAQPSGGHKYLHKLAGTWDAHATFWMQPGALPTESKGTSVNEVIMGGRYLKTDYTSEFMGSPFQGMALDGFDNQKQRFVGLWIDTMSTLMMVFEGTVDEAAAVRTMTAEYTDAMTGKPAKMKGVTTVVNEDEHRYEAWTTGKDGEMFKTMEIVYKRK